MSAKAERLHLRVDAAQKALLDAATAAAADVLADRQAFLLDEDAWRVFDEALERPAQDVAGLRELLTAPTLLSRSNQVSQ